MKIARFSYTNGVAIGVVEDERIQVVEGDIFGTFRPSGVSVDCAEVKLLPPVYPSKIIALGLNYRDHAEELNLEIPSEPLIFMKPSSAVIGHLDVIRYPAMSERVDFEGELGIVIGREAAQVEESDAHRFILGYTCVNDVTARDLQQKDGQWTRAKGFDTFAPIGPWLDTEIDPNGLCIETFLNGERTQSSTTSNLIFKPAFVVSFVSRIMTLYPGDVIATGTPSGIGPMVPGDTVDVVIEGIGSLTNRVVASR